MSSGGKERFPKTARLRKRPQFLKLSRTGKKVHSSNFVIITKISGTAESRLGITVSGKVANAVVRNRLKRLVREVFRRHRHEFAPGLDILVIARKGDRKLSLSRVEDEIVNSLTTQRRRQNRG
ncbi:MAG TPA: ribonuclease P protein component [Candidatus Binatia bacterium]|nr:ribonuclease P protein component [Candidatus Binatia bacterium]